jgi:hypothetical protein
MPQSEQHTDFKGNAETGAAKKPERLARKTQVDSGGEEPDQYQFIGTTNCQSRNYIDEGNRDSAKRRLRTATLSASHCITCNEAFEKAYRQNHIRSHSPAPLTSAHLRANHHYQDRHPNHHHRHSCIWIIAQYKQSTKDSFCGNRS